MSIEYRPVTGVGRFKAKLKGNELEIKHRLFLIGRLYNEPSTGELLAFQNRLLQLIPAHWEGKYCFKRGLQTIRPKFVLRFLNDGEKQRAHFVVNVTSKTENQVALVARDAYYLFAKGKSDDQLADVSRSTNLSVVDVNPVHSVILQQADLKKMLPMYVDFYNNQMSQHTQVQIKTLLTRLATLAPQPRLYVTGYGTNANGNQTTIANLMRQCGLTNVHNRRSKKALIQLLGVLPAPAG